MSADRQPTHPAPKRIQRKRTRGWKMPPNTIYVGRPSKWGNPYGIRGNMNRLEAVEGFRKWVNACNHLSRIDIPRIKAELRGKNLACWCPLSDKDGNHVPCHADVLLESPMRNCVQCGTPRPEEEFRLGRYRVTNFA